MSILRASAVLACLAAANAQANVRLASLLHAAHRRWAPALTHPFVAAAPRPWPWPLRLFLFLALTPDPTRCLHVSHSWASQSKTKVDAPQP